MVYHSVQPASHPKTGLVRRSGGKLYVPFASCSAVEIWLAALDKGHIAMQVPQTAYVLFTSRLISSRSGGKRPSGQKIFLLMKAAPWFKPNQCGIKMLRNSSQNFGCLRAVSVKAVC